MRVAALTTLLLSLCLTTAEVATAGKIRLKGKLRDLESGEVIKGGGITISSLEASGSGKVKKSGRIKGRFEVECDSDGEAPAVPLDFEVEGKDYYERRLHVFKCKGKVKLDANLMPRKAAELFELDQFDHLWAGRSSRFGLVRLVNAPKIEIWDRVVLCPETSFTCEVSSSEVAETWFDLAREAVDMYNELGVLPESLEVTVHSPAEGSTVDASKRKPGVIQMLFYERPGESFSWSTGGRVFILTSHTRTVFIFLHELGHELGMIHPAGQDNVPFASVMGRAPVLSHLDKLYLRTSFGRAPCTVSPDHELHPAEFCAIVRGGSVALPTRCSPPD